ncbi:hypothetical protein [Dactylosporangium darangshiense]|uniref:Uncharacterized protein n=1 Tax=Dactylosporangium darangshiense TaxID=579108 RepID=A0ABP8D9R4_9ACTN
MMVLAGGAFVAKDLLVGYVTSNDLIVPAAEQEDRHITLAAVRTNAVETFLASHVDLVSKS